MARYSLNCDKGDYQDTAKTEDEVKEKKTAHELANDGHTVNVLDYGALHVISKFVERVFKKKMAKKINIKI